LIDVFPVLAKNSLEKLKVEGGHCFPKDFCANPKNMSLYHPIGTEVFLNLQSSKEFSKRLNKKTFQRDCLVKIKVGEK
jgi:hypothetical protein